MPLGKIENYSQLLDQIKYIYRDFMLFRVTHRHTL